MKTIASVLLALVISSSQINATEFTSLRSIYSDIIYSNPDSLDQFSSIFNTKLCLEDAFAGYAFCLNEILHSPHTSTKVMNEQSNTTDYTSKFGILSDVSVPVQTGSSLNNFNKQGWYLQQDSLTDEGGIKIRLFR